MPHMKRAVLYVIGIVAAALLVLPGGVFAAPAPGTQAETRDPLENVSGGPVCLAIPIFKADAPSTAECPSGQIPADGVAREGGPIVWYAIEVMKLISVVIGGVIILVLVMAGINYITSAGDPSGVKTAKKRIQNAITALILYLSMFAILNFLIPGGILIGG